MNSLLIFALALFVITYVLMFSFQQIRPHVAIVSALIFVAVGSLRIFPDFNYTWTDALAEIDYDGEITLEADTFHRRIPSALLAPTLRYMAAVARQLADTVDAKKAART